MNDAVNDTTKDDSSNAAKYINRSPKTQHKQAFQ
jgi:hypothetical protein